MEQLLSPEDLLSLSREVKSALEGESSFQRHGWELLWFLLRAGLFLSGLAVLARAGGAAKTAGLAAMAYAYYGIAITGVHEASHNAFARSPRANALWSLFFSDFWSGQSSEWWHHRHVSVHHAFTNILDKDPQLFFFPWIRKHVYFFAVPFLVVPWLVFHSVAFLRRRPKALALYLVLAAAGFAVQFALLRLVLPAASAGYALFAVRSLFAPLFMHLALFNHVGLDNPAIRMPWIEHQTRTTRNVTPNWFLRGLGGNAFLECHLEHHIFPALSNRMLAKVKPLVRRFLEKRGYAYVEEGYWSCLKTSLACYDSLFAAGPPAVVELV